MASFIVMVRPDRDAAGQGVVFLRDGFSWLAFLFPPLWLLWNRLWIEAVLVFAVLFMLSAAGEATGLIAASAFVSLLVSLFVGLEQGALRASALRRRFYADAGVVEADDLDEAEIRYFAGETEDAVPAVPPLPTPVPAGIPRPAPQPALGLVPYPVRR